MDKEVKTVGGFLTCAVNIIKAAGEAERDVLLYLGFTFALGSVMWVICLGMLVIFGVTDVTTFLLTLLVIPSTMLGITLGILIWYYLETTEEER